MRPEPAPSSWNRFQEAVTLRRQQRTAKPSNLRWAFTMKIFANYLPLVLVAVLTMGSSCAAQKRAAGDSADSPPTFGGAVSVLSTINLCESSLKRYQLKAVSSGCHIIGFRLTRNDWQALASSAAPDNIQVRINLISRSQGQVILLEKSLREMYDAFRNEKTGSTVLLTVHAEIVFYDGPSQSIEQQTPPEGGILTRNLENCCPQKYCTAVDQIFLGPKKTR